MTIEQYVEAYSLPVDSVTKDRIVAACAACDSAINGVLTTPRLGTINESKGVVCAAALELAVELDACLPASAVEDVGPMVGRLRQVAVRAACGELPNATAAADVSARMCQIRAAAIDGLALAGGGS